VLLIFERTHDLALAGFVAGAASLSGAITGPFLGGWLDIADSRRRLLVLDQLVTAVSLAILLALAGHAPNWLLPIAALVYGSTAPLSAGAFSALLPEVAGRDLLDIANAFEGASINAAFIVGPALSGLLAATAGPATAIEVQIGLGFVLALLIAGDETFERRPDHGEARPEGVLHAVSQGLSATWRIKALRWNMVIDCFYVLAWGTLNVGFPAYAVAVGGAAHDAGYMWAVIAAGSLLGGFALRRRGEAHAQGLFIGGYLLAMAASAAAWPLAGGLGLALALILLTGVLDGPGLVGLISIRQRVAPAHVRAQIFTTATSLHSASFAAGAAGAGLLHRAFGTNAIIFAFAGLIVVAALIAMVSQYEQDAVPQVAGTR
jgi:predicted MFS family arabinose efflux permease